MQSNLELARKEYVYQQNDNRRSTVKLTSQSLAARQVEAPIPNNNFSIKIKKNSDMVERHRTASNPHPKKKPKSFSTQPQGGSTSALNTIQHQPTPNIIPPRAHPSSLTPQKTRNKSQYSQPAQILPTLRTAVTPMSGTINDQRDYGINDPTRPKVKIFDQKLHYEFISSQKNNLMITRKLPMLKKK